MKIRNTKYLRHPSSLNILSVMVLLFYCTLVGCTSEYNLATQKQETLLYGTVKEVGIGEAMASKMEQQYEIITDVDTNERVQGIFDRLIAVADRKDIVYFIKVIDEDIMNAVSLPGGYVYVFQGLIDKVDSDDELAGVIAHEIAHITAKHSVKRIQNMYGALILQGLASQSNAKVAQGVGLALTSLFMEYSQEDEFEADRLGVKYLKKAGFDPHAMTRLLDKLRKEEEQGKIREYSYWRTHPYISSRIAIVNQAVTGKMDFKDYLNLMGE